MFMGPFDREKLWSTEAVNGCKRCLNRFYDMVHSEKVSDQPLEEAMKLSHRLVHAVTSDLEVMQFNTAIARMMEFLNAFIPLPRYPREALKRAVQMLYPFAPHLAEELWERLGEKNSITYEPIPPIDPAYLEDPVATYVVQINGKLRGRFELPKNLVESEVMDHARQQPEVAKYLEGEIIKTVYIPNKLLNIVIK
jgi:leucyl-tRNA synthetase